MLEKKKGRSRKGRVFPAAPFRPWTSAYKTALGRATGLQLSCPEAHREAHTMKIRERKGVFLISSGPSRPCLLAGRVGGDVWRAGWRRDNTGSAIGGY